MRNDRSEMWRAAAILVRTEDCTAWKDGAGGSLLHGPCHRCAPRLGIPCDRSSTSHHVRTFVTMWDQAMAAVKAKMPLIWAVISLP